MMAGKTLRDLKVAGKRVLVRVDFNVPMKDGKITDDTRIRAALPTIQFLRERGARLVLTSHLGRPKDAPDLALSLAPVASRLAQLLDCPVQMAERLSGAEVEELSRNLEPGEVLLLENSRFDPREKKNDPSLAEELARLADLYVNDAFGAAHRAHATTVGVAERLPAVPGFLMEKEIAALETVVSRPRRPFVAVLGGAKVTDKIGVIDRFLELADAILVGGAMCFTFFRAQGLRVGASRVEDEKGVDTARRALGKAAASHCELILPVDLVIAERVEEGTETRIVQADAIPDGWMGLDIGPRTAEIYGRRIREAGEVFWNGPMGVFEVAAFAAGTEAVARAMAEASGVTIIGGGDSVAAVGMLGLTEKMDHVSTGGGASLEFIEGGGLPGVDVLRKQGSPGVGG
jgi:phosphoglycerate kinase